MASNPRVYDLKSFIEMIVLPDLKKLIDQQLHYYAFGIICQLIEVMGSVFDHSDLDTPKLSEARFDNAIRNLFREKKYREKQNLFFSVLRGPLIHQLRPGPQLFLSSSTKDGIEAKHHLAVDELGRTILVVEQFYEDLEDAFARFCRTLQERNDLHQQKVTEPFVCVTHTSPKMDTSWWDKDANDLLTITPAITGRAEP
jgi:hypothetical protein